MREEQQQIQQRVLYGENKSAKKFEDQKRLNAKCMEATEREEKNEKG